MKTKTFLQATLLGIFLHTMSVVSATNEVIPAPLTTHEVSSNKTPEQLLTRLSEIEHMDKDALTKAEKKQLRKETKEINDVLKTQDGGVYLSVGAIIIIALLLIILL